MAPRGWVGLIIDNNYGLIFEIPAKILARDLTGAARAIGRDDSDL